MPKLLVWNQVLQSQNAPPQNLNSAERQRRQIQTERDELQDDNSNQKTKKYVAHNQKPFPHFIWILIQTDVWTYIHMSDIFNL